MDLRQLRYFVAIVEAGSFSRAAERVHVVQSALSLHVRRLEERLGVQLLVREAKGVRPTEAGQKLLVRAQAIFALISETESELRSTQVEPSGPVAIGIPSGVGRLFNAPLLEAAARKLPRVSLRIVEVLPGHVSEWVAAGLTQLGVCYDIGDTPVGESLAEEEFHLVCSSPESGLLDSVALADLPHFPLVLPTCSHNPAQCVATRAKSLGVELTIETRVDSLATILDLVQSRGGRAILTPGAFLPEWRAGRVLAYPIEPVMKRSVLLEVSPAAAAEPAVRAVELLVRTTASALVTAGSWPRRLPSQFPKAA